MQSRSVTESSQTCWRPDDLRSWGWAVQLYSARSKLSWGIGDLGDLATIASWARDLGARVILLNPLHAALPGPQEPNPYFASSRCWRNPLYLRIEDVPGAGEAGRELAELATSGRALNDDVRIDRDAVYALKMKALGLLWSRFEGSDEFEQWRTQRGRLLADFATFQSLAEHFGGGTDHWPAGYEHPRSPAVEAWREQHRDRIEFHEWVQWLVGDQLAGVAAQIRLVHDLAVGVAPSGFDAWLWQDIFDSGVTVGAPPDQFSSAGQDWGVPAFDPAKLQEAGYEPFVSMIRAAFENGAGARIDHVMSLFRLWLIPEGAGPTEGMYVRYPHTDLLDIVARESQDACAFVVGEDLGTVEPEVRVEMAARRMLSSRIMWFEDDEPSKYPELSVAAVTNHDLPTIAGVWTGADLAEQRALGLNPDASAAHSLRRRLRELGVSEDAPVEEVVRATYERLATAGSAVVLGTLEDALGIRRRPNLPGTSSYQRDNWSIGLPKPLEEVTADPLVADVARALASHRS